MINDEERRRVAKKLLEIIWCMRKREEFYKSDVDPIRCGNVTYRNIAGSVEESGNLIKGNYINIVERLANLIDRPTCKPKDRGIGYVDAVCDSFCCPNCGFEIDVHIGEEQHLTEAAKYCPNCGAEVQE